MFKHKASLITHNHLSEESAKNFPTFFGQGKIQHKNKPGYTGLIQIKLFSY